MPFDLLAVSSLNHTSVRFASEKGAFNDSFSQSNVISETFLGDNDMRDAIVMVIQTTVVKHGCHKIKLGVSYGKLHKTNQDKYPWRISSQIEKTFVLQRIWM